MKARKIKRIRKILNQCQPYVVQGSLSLFGRFTELEYQYFDKKNIVLALNPDHAILRYMHKYRRIHKRKHDRDTGYYNETTQNWGKIMVISKKGYRYFYR